MKRLKKELSFLLIIALVASSLVLGVGQLKSSAYTDAPGTGIFRVNIGITLVNCGEPTGATDSSFRLQFLNAAGAVVSATPDNAIEGRPEINPSLGDPLESGPSDSTPRITTYTWDGSGGGNVAYIVPSLATLAVSKAITQVQLVNTYWEDNWYFQNVSIYYSYDGGANWVTLASNSWNSGQAGAVATWSAGSAFTSTYLKTLTFNANGGTGGGTYDAIAGQTIAAPSVPTRAGYTFTGWSPSVPARMPNANATYTAQWTPAYSSITFNANGGTGGTGPTVMPVDSALTAPAVTRTGYTFLNWLPAVPATVPRADTTYTAQWRETNPAVTFDSDGGSAVEAITPGYNNSASKPADPAKAGFTFGGWYWEPALTTAVYWPFTVTQSVVLYARWNTENCYTMIFDANGGTGGTSAAWLAGDPLTAPAVARTGYTLAGWLPVIPETVPSENTVYTAQWSANTYTVGYNGNGNDAGSTASSLHTYDNASNLTANGFTKVGNSFLGWSTDQSATAASYTNAQSVLNLTPNRDEVITFYAVWSANFYIITFSANGGSGGTTTSMQYGAALAAPTVTRTGYIFASWSPAVPATVPAAHSTYTAQWTANQYVVTFDPQGGTVSPTSSTVSYGSTYGAGTGGFPTPTKTGCTFGGWYTGTNGSGSKRLSTSSVTTASDHTLYAKWTGISYTIAYNGNGSTGGSTANSSHTYNTAKALTANGFTKTGFAFIGWATSADSPVVYSDSQSVLNLTETSGATVTLYAKWTDVNVSTITFDANGGTGGKSMTLLIGATLTAPAVTKTGYTFTSWSPSVSSTVPAENTTYTAQWTANTITVTFDPQSGTVSPTTSAVSYGSTYGTGTGGLPTPVRTGYTFSGWYTGPSGSGTNIQSNTTVTIISSHTLYATWIANQYTITFDANGGTGGTSGLMTYATALTAPAVIREGYTLIGWSPSVPSTVPASDTTYTAQWGISVTITFDANGGTGGTSSVKGAGAALTAPTVTRTGYTFAGWTPTVPSTVPAVNTTYTAQWTARTFTVTFNPQSGTVSPTTSIVNYGSTYGAGTGGWPEPVRTGYTFSGWFTSTGGAGTRILSTTVAARTSSQTLYAYWTSTGSVIITFDANGGTGGTSTTMTVGAALTVPVVARAGYIFTGWLPSVPPAVPDADTTYTAQWSAESTDFTYTIANGQATITKYTGAGGNVIIPATRGGYPVVEIGPKAFFNIDTLTGVTIPDSVTSVGDEAFRLCDGLLSVSIGSGLVSLGSLVFYYCDKLGQINVNSQNNYFSELNGVLFNKDKTTLVCYPGGRAGAYIIPDGVVNIGEHAFAFCMQLTSVTMPDSVMIIEKSAFFYCIDLAYLNISSKVTYIGDSAFDTCDDLVSITIPASVSYIGKDAFINYYEGLTSIVVEENNGFYSSHNGVLYNKEKTTLIRCPGGKSGSYSIPGSVKSIETNAFYRCSLLTDVYIPESVTQIGISAFEGCTGLISIVIPDSVTNIGERAFFTCNLSSVTLGRGLTSIERDTFFGCDFISVRIPSNIINIGKDVFYGCTNMTAAYFYGDAPAMTTSANAFRYVASGFTVYHLPDKTGFTSPTWYTYPTAIFTPVSTITFDANGGTGGTSASMTYGTTLTAPVVTKPGYVFTGWSPAVPATVPAQDTAYTAQWSISVTITFDANGGTGGTSAVMSYGATLTAPTVTRTGYTLTGWSPTVPSTVPAANTTYIAQWSQDPVLVPPAESTAVIDNARQTIYGLAEGITREDFESMFVSVTGNGRLEITPTSYGFGTGTRIDLVNNATNEVADTWYIVIFGDVNGDGIAGSVDADLICNFENFAVEWDPMTEPYLFTAGDLNKDGNIEAVDADIIYNCENFVMWIDQTTGMAAAY